MTFLKKEFTHQLKQGAASVNKVFVFPEDCFIEKILNNFPAPILTQTLHTTNAFLISGNVANIYM